LSGRSASGEFVALADAWKVPVLQDRLSDFGKRLAERRADILANWTAKVGADPKLLTGASLPLAQLHDHLAALLEDFETRLGIVGRVAGGRRRAGGRRGRARLAPVAAGLRPGGGGA
jgi:hypothetical protein